MSYKLKYTGEQIDNILDRAVEGGTIDDALDLKAPLESPALTGTPTAPTQAEGDNSTKVATTAYADRAADAAEAAAEAAAKEYTDEATSALYITDTASGSIASFADGADGVAMRSVKVAVTPVQSGSGDPSPDNVRPISGWTGAEIPVTGINVWDEDWELGVIATNGNLLDRDNSIRSANYISVKQNTSYYFYIGKSTYRARVVYFDGGKTAVGGKTDAPPFNFTTPSNCVYIKICTLQDNEPFYGDTYLNDISINYPSSDHDYHAYAGQAFPVTWQSQAGEVFGGTVDVVSGELKVTHGILTANNFNMGGMSAGGQKYFNAAGSSAKTDGEGISSMLRRLDNSAAWNSANPCFAVGAPASAAARVYDGTLASIEEFRTKYAELLVVYELAAPTTYHLDSIGQITSLLGQNNVWSNTGDTEATYVADPKLYIAKVLGGGALTLGSASQLSLNRPVTISKEDLEQADEVNKAVEAAVETVLPAESGETEEGAQE